MHLLLRIVPVLLVMGTIFFLSHQYGDTLSPYLPAFPGADKICHLAIYGLLAMTVLWCLGPGKQVSLVKMALKTVIFCLAYGMSDEFHQSFIPQRSVSALDLLADLAGALRDLVEVQEAAYLFGLMVYDSCQEAGRRL